MVKQRVTENRFSERSSVLGIRKRIRHSALRHRDADHAIRYAGQVQYFENQINSCVSRTEQVAFALFQFYFSGGNGAGSDLVFKPRGEECEPAFFALTRDEEECQAAHTCRSFFRTRSNNG